MSSSTTKNTLTEKQAEALLQKAFTSSISGDVYRRVIAVIINYDFDGRTQNFKIVSNMMEQLFRDGYKFEVHRIIIPSNHRNPNLPPKSRNFRALAHIRSVLDHLEHLDDPETLLIINHRTHGGFKQDDSSLYLCSGKYTEPYKSLQKEKQLIQTSVAFRDIMESFEVAKARIVCLADSCSADRAETEVPHMMLAACGKEEVTKSDDQGFGPNLLSLLQSALDEERWMSLGMLYSALVNLDAGNDIFSAPKWRPGREIAGVAPDVVIEPVERPDQEVIPKQAALAKQYNNLEIRQKRKQTGSTIWVGIHVNPLTQNTVESLANGLRRIRLMPGAVDVEVDLGQGYVKEEVFEGNSAWLMVRLDNMVYVHLPNHPAINYCFGPCPPIRFTVTLLTPHSV